MLKKLSKRAKFVFSTLALSVGLFISQYLSPEPRTIFVVLLAFLSTSALFVILYEDIKGTFWFPILILPFFWTLAFGLFYFLLPSRFLTRIAITAFFLIGLYALYLTHNIYAVAGIRTIKLFRAARTVGLMLVIVTYFFLTNVIFSLHLQGIFALLIIFLLTVFLVFQVIWSVNLENKISKATGLFTLFLSLVLGELYLMLNFWPASPTVAALFLAGNFYTFVGLSAVWLERRLFKGTLWEYVWVSIIVFLVLITRTKWGG